jgi:hypothetical protein
VQALAEARWKRTRAVELALEGRSYEEIAHAVRFAHQGSAHRAVRKALSAREVEAVDDLRQEQLDRLDRLQEAVWDKALAGDLDAVALILKVIDQRSRLLGLAAQSGSSAEPRQLVLGPS